MFEVISHGGGAFIMQVLNGVAMIFGSNDYIFALKICATLASVGILVGCAFSGKVPDVKWIIITICVYVFVFLPKVDVTVTDTVERTMYGGTPTVRVAGNVPMGLAFVASFSSHMSDYVTRTFETVFSMPDQINYRGGGLLFAEAITESALNAKVRDPNLSMSLANFWHDCVFYDLGLGFYSMTELSQAEDIQAFLSSNTAAGRAYEFINSDGAKSYEMCRESISSGGRLANALDAEVTKKTAMISASNDASSTANMNNLITSNASAMPVAFAYLTKMSKSATEILTQSMLSNSFGDGLVAFANSADAASVMNGYVAAKAEAERNTTFTVLGKLSAKMLPMLKNIFEGLIYAMTPIIGMFMMFPGAHKVALGYVQALLWIMLWAPLFAVFHWASSFFTALAAEKAALLCGKAAACTGGSISMYSMHGIVEVMTSSAAIAGYIGVSIPMIAYMLVSKSGAMMASIAGRTMDGYQQPVSKASAEATAGNVTMGNVSYDNATAFQNVTAPSNTAGFSKNDNGRTVDMQTGSGGIGQVRADSGPASINAQSSVQSAISQQQTEATRAKEATGSTLTTAAANQYSAQVGAEKAIKHSTTVGSGSGVDTGTSDSTTATNVRNALHKYGESKGVDAKYLDQAAADLGLGLKVGGSGAGITEQAKNSKEYKDAQQAALEFSRSDDLRHALSTSKDAYLRTTAGNSDDVSVTGRNAVTNAASQTTTAQQAHTAAVEREASVALVAQDIKTNGVGAGADLSGYLKRRVENDGGTWETFNVGVNNGDGATHARLNSYAADYAKEYIEKAVTKTQADVGRDGDAAVAGLNAEGRGAVGAATGAGVGKVATVNAVQGTGQGAEAVIKAEAGGVIANSAQTRLEQEAAAVAEGQNVANVVDPTIKAGEKAVDTKVDERADKTVGEAVVVETLKDGRAVIQEGGGVVDKAAGSVGIDLHKVDEFFGFGGNKDSDKR